MNSSRTQIVATLGPASGLEPLVSKLIDAGMDVARLNFSHGTHDDHAAYVAALRAAAEQQGKRIPIIQDLSGPRGITAGGHAFDDAKDVLTDKDLSDLEWGIAQQVEYVAQSYVGSAAHVTRLKNEIASRGAVIPVIAKIERKEAVDAIDAIIAVADAIMVARGDLGLAVPPENIPFIERDVIARCNTAGKPVIVATQMLYSMVENSEPTRAEVTDEEFAILFGADAVMLSDETARGKYPVEAVQWMERIAHRAEREQSRTPLSL